jgi:hypothetical protein
VIVAALVDVNVNAPVYVLVSLNAGSVRLPAILKAVVPAKVIVPSSPLIVKSRQAEPVLIVTVKFATPVLLLPSKITSSADVGAVAPMVADDMVRLVSVDEALIV